MHSKNASAGTRLKTAQSPDKQQGTSVCVELRGFPKADAGVAFETGSATSAKWPGVY